MKHIVAAAIAIIVCFASVTTEAKAPARTSKAVKKEKAENSRQMERTRNRISENSREVTRQLADLDRLGADIRQSNTRIAGLNSSIDSLTLRQHALTDSVEAAEAHLERLKDSYAKALRTLRRQRQIASPVAYIFSSRSFSQARKRIRYLDELSRWQAAKAREIKAAAARLTMQRNALAEAKHQLSAQAYNLNKERNLLRDRQTKTDALVGKLRKQGKQLEKTLSDQQAKARRLDQELSRIIEEEARRAAEEARRKKEAEARRQGAQPPKDGKAPDKQTAPPAESGFASAKGRLPMPVSGPAVIVSEFGRHTHGSLEKVEVQNNGIDIETSKGAYAVAVYPGVVTMVIVMDGYNNVVLVRHGEYLTVYAGIARLEVKKGQEVKAGQVLGSLYTDPATDHTRLHFEVRHEKEKLDPAQWLR